MYNLKTLKDLQYEFFVHNNKVYSHTLARKNNKAIRDFILHLRLESIEWYKVLNPKINVQEFIKHTFNINEEDLK